MNFLTDMAAKRAEIASDDIAFRDHESGRSLRFGQVNDAANRLAHDLVSRGLTQGDRLAILCLNCPEFFIYLFAAQKAGLILVPLNWRQPFAELQPILEASGAKLIVHDDEHKDLAGQLAESCGIRSRSLETRALDGGGADAFGDGRIDPDAPWYLLYTSGTTGQPKAVIQTAGMAWANYVNYTQPMTLDRSDCCLNYLPLFHTAGINLPTLPLFLLGGTSVFLKKFDVDAVYDLIGEGAITSFFGVPAIYQAMALHEKFASTDFTALRSLGCGGAPIPERTLEEFLDKGAVICNGMGMTETGPTVFLMDPENAARKPGSVGKAQVMTDVRLAGSEGGIVEGQGEGELQLRGPGISPGYFENDSATQKAFTSDGWLRTGDVARRDEDGYFYIVDRIKDMYISGGENVYPAEVEQVLHTHPAILEAVVFGVPDTKWGEVGRAVLIARPGEHLDVDALGAWCRKRLAAYKIPKSFEIAAVFPRTAAGKVRKNILKDEFLTANEEA